MKQKALAVLEKLRSIWSGLSRAKQITYAIVAACLIAAAATAWAVASQEHYDYLFTDLSTEDAAAIVTKLGELKIPHKVEAGGTAIMVPAETVHEIRLQIASAGLPRGGGVGFELFDKTRFGATEFEQQVNLRRALEGELARTISTISSVKTARVHLVLPERSVFSIRRETGSASVVLQLHPDRAFGKRETQSVVHLVASAIPGLSPDNVSLVTTEGVTLHRPAKAGAEGGGGDENSLADRELELSSVLENRVRSMLDSALGPGHAEVRVGVTLDPSVTELTKEQYGRGPQAIHSLQHSHQGPGPEGVSAEGVPGAVSNLPGMPGDQPAASASASAGVSPDDVPAGEPPADGANAVRKNWVVNYDVDKTTQKTSIPPGMVKRISVAVVVDGVRKALPNGAEEYSPRPPEDLQAIGNMVKGAVGFDTERNDTVQVESMRFASIDKPEVPAAGPVPAARPWWQRWQYLAGAGAAVGVLMIAGVVATRRKRTKVPDQATARVLLAEGAGPDASIELTGKHIPGLPAGPQVDPQELREAAIQLAVRDPATAAVILREWLSAPSTIVTPAAMKASSNATAIEAPRG